MLTARLEVPIGPEYHAVGPEPFFRAEGETLKTASGEHVGVHRAGLWQVGNVGYIAVSFDASVGLTFDDPHSGAHAEFGPYPRLRIVNGSIWVKVDGNVQLLAHFSDATQLWTVYPTPTLKAGILTIKPTA
jgi:hypothetical protein